MTNVNFGGPAGGSRTWKGAFARMGVATWVVETEIAFSSRRVIFFRTSPREIEGKMLGGFCKKYGTKNDNLSGSCLTISVKSCQIQDKCM